MTDLLHSFSAFATSTGDFSPRSWQHLPDDVRERVVGHIQEDRHLALLARTSKQCHRDVAKALASPQRCELAQRRWDRASSDCKVDAFAQGAGSLRLAETSLRVDWDVPRQHLPRLAELVRGSRQRPRLHWAPAAAEQCISSVRMMASLFAEFDHAIDVFDAGEQDPARAPWGFNFPSCIKRVHLRCNAVTTRHVLDALWFMPSGLEVTIEAASVATVPLPFYSHPAAPLQRLSCSLDLGECLAAAHAFFKELRPGALQLKIVGQPAAQPLQSACLPWMWPSRLQWLCVDVQSTLQLPPLHFIGQLRSLVLDDQRRVFTDVLERLWADLGRALQLEALTLIDSDTFDSNVAPAGVTPDPSRPSSHSVDGTELELDVCNQTNDEYVAWSLPPLLTQLKLVGVRLESIDCGPEWPMSLRELHIDSCDLPQEPWVMPDTLDLFFYYPAYENEHALFDKFLFKRPPRRILTTADALPPGWSFARASAYAGICIEETSEVPNERYKAFPDLD